MRQLYCYFFILNPAESFSFFLISLISVKMLVFVGKYTNNIFIYKIKFTKTPIIIF